MALLKSDPQALKKGDPAPAFTLRNVDGKEVSLSDFRGKALVVIFMCNHCPYVKPKMDEIASIQHEYLEKGVEVVCVSSNDVAYVPEDSFEEMKKLAKEKGYRYYLYDSTQDVAKAYGATCTPDPFVFDSEHRLFYHGRINDAMNPGDEVREPILRKMLDTMLGGGEADPWFLPSMGCSIKWR